MKDTKNDFLNFEKIPTSVYRLQLNQAFPLSRAIEILPYLKELGIEGVYCSPYFKAFSAHGYDVTDPNQLNPLIGTEEEYAYFCQSLKKLGLKHIADIVPNHMGIKGGQNRWWQDVLENGPYSTYADFFDIDWTPEKQQLRGRVLLPVLGAPYGCVLENQELKLRYEAGTFTVFYHDYPFPIAPHTYAYILEKALEKMAHPELKELFTFYQFFLESVANWYEKKEEGEKRLAALVAGSLHIQAAIEQTVNLFNGKKKHPHSFDLLDALLEQQFYRLSFWKVASHEINYRRFFNIHELVSIRIEELKVLEKHHQRLFQLVQAGEIQGIRIDHPDGLYDPIRYFQRLRERLSVLTVVEKILERKEHLPDSWSVDGTVGYEYLNILNGLFIDQEGEKQFTEIYEEFTGKTLDFEECVYQSKKLFTSLEMVSEVENLGLKLDRLSETSRYDRDFTRHDLTEALSEVIATFPVYRTYITPEGKVRKRDSRIITIAIEKAKHRAKHLDPSIFHFLEQVLLNKLKVDKPMQKKYLDFVLQFQQLTGPVMAKGLEDTTFYRYNRLISLNEVGGDPPHFGYSIPEFHRMNQQKKEKWPYGFLATSTHDTKRSEDVRARLNVLSEIPEKWSLELRKWKLVNSKHKPATISDNTEYFLYQTLLGMWPRSCMKKAENTAFIERAWQVMLKAIREAKEETSWLAPNSSYEEDVHAFIETILTPSKNNHFLKHFLPFQRLLDYYGALNSLSQTALKIGSPGIVDIFQGNERLTYKMVDPDNRGSIDFTHSSKLLQAAKKHSLQSLYFNGEFDQLKLGLTLHALSFRSKEKELFLLGEYMPLKVRGPFKKHVVAFLRVYKNQYLIVIATRFFAQLAEHHHWVDTEVQLPSNGLSHLDSADLLFHDLFTKNQIHVKKRGKMLSLNLSEILNPLPFSYLYGDFTT